MEDFDDLNTSMRRLLQSSKSGQNNSMGGGSISSMKKSVRSPFKRSNSKTNMMLFWMVFSYPMKVNNKRNHQHEVRLTLMVSILTKKET